MGTKSFPFRVDKSRRQESTQNVTKNLKQADNLPGISSSFKDHDSVVQSIVSLINELVSGQNVNCSSKYSIKFTGIFAEKCEQFAKATHILFSKNISIYAICNNQSFNDTLTNDIISFEQLGP